MERKTNDVARQSFFGGMGCAAAIVFTVFGAAYGTAKSSGAVFSSGILRPERVMQNNVSLPMRLFMRSVGNSKCVDRKGEEVYPLTNAHSLCAIMAQILSIYGFVVSVIISGDLKEMMSLHKGFMQVGAGVSVGLGGLAAGFAIGIVGDAGVRASSQQPRLYVGMVLILIFAEVLGLYGVIVSILMLTRAKQGVTECLY
ncbi:uncharacterized protein PG986_013312 [Apiospora aurea]|uniref:V-ATPase proteolipid subunit C-like domain-containing protein n=1 Tax=Apiospora aurea TaxID=335848 RepID=A0ABR1PW85_9PEZI